MDSLPIITVTGSLGRSLLFVTCFGILSTVGAMVRMHTAEYEITAHRASLVATGAFLVSVTALVAAVVVGSAA